MDQSLWGTEITWVCILLEGLEATNQCSPYLHYDLAHIHICKGRARVEAERVKNFFLSLNVVHLCQLIIMYCLTSVYSTVPGYQGTFVDSNHRHWNHCPKGKV